MQVQTINSQQRVISLYEICKLMGKEHNKAMRIVEEMQVKEGFGGVEKITTPTFNPNGTRNKEIETYSYTKKQALMIGARLDSKNIIVLVNKLEELTQQLQAPQPQIDTNALAMTISTAVVQAMMSIQPLNQETELDKQKKQLEIDKLQLEKIAIVADLSSKYKLEELGSLQHVPSELKKSMALTAGVIVKDVRTAQNGVSLTECLRLSNCYEQPKDFNLELGKLGVLVRVEYQHKYDGTKHCWKVTDDGRYYGYNQHASSKSIYPIQPKFYSDRFGELLDLVRHQAELED
jgi:hypothetical protein